MQYEFLVLINLINQLISSIENMINTLNLLYVDNKFELNLDNEF